MSAVIEYGNEAYLSRIDAIEARITTLHIALPYHNVEHALHTRDIAVGLGLLCIRNGIPVDMFALEAGALLHDADYHKPLPPSIRSKELRSSRIAGHILRELEVPRPTILTAQRAIRATELHKLYVTPEDKILRRADLDNLTANYPSFLLNTYRLYREKAVLGDGKLPPLSDFLRGSVGVLRTYLQTDLDLGPFDQQSFMSRALTNVNHLAVETPKSFLGKLTSDAIDQAASL